MKADAKRPLYLEKNAEGHNLERMGKKKEAGKYDSKK